MFSESYDQDLYTWPKKYLATCIPTHLSSLRVFSRDKDRWVGIQVARYFFGQEILKNCELSERWGDMTWPKNYLPTFTPTYLSTCHREHLLGVNLETISVPLLQERLPTANSGWWWEPSLLSIQNKQCLLLNFVCSHLYRAGWLKLSECLPYQISTIP